MFLVSPVTKECLKCLLTRKNFSFKKKAKCKLCFISLSDDQLCPRCKPEDAKSMCPKAGRSIIQPSWKVLPFSPHPISHKAHEDYFKTAFQIYPVVSFSVYPYSGLWHLYPAKLKFLIVFTLSALPTSNPPAVLPSVISLKDPIITLLALGVCLQHEDFQFSLISSHSSIQRSLQAWCAICCCLFHASVSSFTHPSGFPGVEALAHLPVFNWYPPNSRYCISRC